VANRPCVGCGVCCRESRCYFAKTDADGGCQYQVRWQNDRLQNARYRCGIYEQIQDHPKAKISPAFGVGCGRIAYNYRRSSIIRELKLRREIPEDAE
jgi:hypothetical protein